MGQTTRRHAARTHARHAKKTAVSEKSTCRARFSLALYVRSAYSLLMNNAANEMVRRLLGEVQFAEGALSDAMISGAGVRKASERLAAAKKALAAAQAS